MILVVYMSLPTRWKINVKAQIALPCSLTPHTVLCRVGTQEIVGGWMDGDVDGWEGGWIDGWMDSTLSRSY